MMNTKQQFEAFKNKRYFSSLDGLRFIAVLAVIWHHTASSAYQSINLAQRGPTGVTLFFAISGFLITTLLLREKEIYGHINLKNFYIRRTLRIFPLYYTTIVIYIAAVFFLEKDPERATNFYNNLVYYFTYTSNFFVELIPSGTIFYFAWSLATEEQFYLIWPWIEKHVATIFKMVILIVILILIYLTETETNLAPFIAKEGVINILLLHIMPAIFFGVILAHALNNPKTFHFIYILFGSKWSSIMMLTIALFYLSAEVTSLMLTHFIMALIVLSCVIREDHILARFLKWRPIAWMGMISYGMYLMHMLSYQSVKIVGQKIGIENHILIFVITTIVTVIVASISFRYYESYFLKLKNKFSAARITS